MGIRFSCSDSRMEFSSLCNEFRLGDSRIEVTIFDRLHAPLLSLETFTGGMLEETSEERASYVLRRGSSMRLDGQI